VILSIAVVVIEGLWPLIGIFFHQYAPALTEGLFRVLPFYHMANVAAWAKGGAEMPLGPGTIIAMSQGVSLAVLAAWILAAAAGTQLRFSRQDLN